MTRPQSHASALPSWLVDLLAGLLLVLAAAWPFRQAWIAGALPGAGPDVVSTVWGMWWFQQSWTGAAWGGLSTLVNAPNGAYGSILSPSSAIVFSLAEPLLGVGRAACLAALLQIAGLGLGVVWLGRKLGLNTVASWAGGFLTLVGRYLIYDTGEASLVAIAALPLPIGLGFLSKRGWGPSLGLGACILWASVENPYLALILPVAAGVSWLRDRRLPLAIGTALGCLGTLGISRLFAASANPNYPTARAGEWYRLGPWRIEIVDLPWSRASLRELFWPTDLSWTTDATSAVDASGGLYLGWSVLLLALLGTAWTWRKSWPLLLGSLAALLLALGSFPGGPFVVLNGLMNAFLRPLTQPTRFLALASVCLSVLAAYGVHALHERLGPKSILLLIFPALDGLFLGGLSLRPPSQSVPADTCMTDLDGAVLIWPSDARMADPSMARMLQMAHGQPAPHRGIASWRLEGQDAHRPLWDAGFSDVPDRTPLRWGPITALGYRNLVVLDGAPDLPIVFPEPACRAEGLSVYPIAALPNERAAPRRH